MVVEPVDCYISVKHLVGDDMRKEKYFDINGSWWRRFDYGSRTRAWHLSLVQPSDYDYAHHHILWRRDRSLYNH